MADGDLISRASLLAGIAELKESPWYNFGKVDGTNLELIEGMWHYGYLQRKEAVEIIEEMCIEKEPAVKTDDILKQIKDFKKCVKSENSDYLTGYLSALSAVEGMLANYDNGWISVKDRLPEDETVSSKDNTYKDLLVQSMERINNEKGNYSLCLSEFCISLSALIVYLTAEHEKRLSEKEPTIIEVFDILRGSDFVKSAITGLQMYRFVSWLLEETIEESNDEGEIDWYHFHQIAGKWNEFTATEASESEDGK